MSELDVLMQGMSEERKKEILDKADRMEVYFNTAGVLFMKDKDEEWVEGIFDNEGKDEYLTKLDKGQAL